MAWLCTNIKNQTYLNFQTDKYIKKKVMFAIIKIYNDFFNVINLLVFLNVGHKNDILISL